ncbi:MAG: ATP-binding protein [Pseudomonadota bacterium]
MKAAEFLKWAQQGCKIYGDDPWFFLRELAQNSRDANAGHIRVRAYRSAEDHEVLEFEDDGSGMSLEHARNYLFRLYASSKDFDKRSAGKYGIGFWSVLRFGAIKIIVESRTGEDQWAILFDDSMNLRKVMCGLDRRGTRITLVREAVLKDKVELREAVGQALKRYCRYLRRNNRRSSKLPVIYNDKNITRSIRLPGPISLRFLDGPVEGAVGLAEKPSVRLLARGLPVWEGVLLDELSHVEESKEERSELAHGLAPVFLLNGNNLDVVMNRKAAIDDKSMQTVIRSARRALSRLVQLHMEHAFPRSLPRKMLDAGARAWRQLVATPPVYHVIFILLIALAVLAVSVLPDYLPMLAGGSRGGKAGRSPGPASSDSTIPSVYRGAAVSERTAGDPVDLAYDPKIPAWFKILTADHYDPGRGFVRSEMEPHLVTLKPGPCRQGCIDVRLRLSAGGKTTLPMPSGYALDAGSLKINGSAGAGAAASIADSGETVVTIPDKGADVEYRCGPSPAVGSLGMASESRLKSLPEGLALPAAIESLVARVSGRDIDTKLAAAVEAARLLVDYDDSARTVKIYGGLEKSGDWLSFVLGAGKGDCDVINGLSILLLRRMDVPARLAVGLVGEQGRVKTSLHAWIEYYDGRWKTVDATPLPASGYQDGREVAGQTAETDGTGPLPPTLVTVAGDASSGKISIAVPAPGPHAERGAARVPESTAAAAPQARDAAPAWPFSGISRTTARIIFVVALVLTVAALFLLIILLARGQRAEKMEKVENRRLAEHIMGQMVASAAVNPRMWRHARGIWFHRILPTLGGARISILQASRLAVGRRLFIARRGNGLAKDAATAGSIVLDRENAAFGKFMTRLSGVVDLDAISELEPMPDRSGEENTLMELLAKVNDVLGDCGAAGIRAERCPGLIIDNYRDVDLSNLSLLRGSAWPKRFIAVNPKGYFIRKCAELYGKNRQLAAWKLIERLSKDSLLLMDGGEKIRRLASQALVGEAA